MALQKEQMDRWLATTLLSALVTCWQPADTSATTLAGTNCVDSAPAAALASVPPRASDDIVAFVGSIGRLGLLPEQQIYLRNNSNVRLEAYVFTVRHVLDWKLVTIEPGAEVNIPLDNVWLAVGTQWDKCKPVADIRTVSVGDLSSEIEQRNGYFIRLLRERRRYELCLSRRQGWVAQQLREKLCE